MFFRMIGEIKVSRDRFRCIVFVFLHVTKVFSENTFVTTIQLIKPNNLAKSLGGRGRLRDEPKEHLRKRQCCSSYIARLMAEFEYSKMIALFVRTVQSAY